MISISLDMGRVPSVLAALANARTAQRMADVAAERYTLETIEWVQSGRSFVDRHGGGGLLGSISWRSAGGGAAMVYANKDYARYVEEGTRPHLIAPKGGRKALKIPTGGPGGFLLRKRVHHPGTGPRPFLYADQTARKVAIQAAAREVLAKAIGEVHG